MVQPKPAPEAEAHSMLDILDRALVRHLERITGSRDGIQGLSMGLVPVACIVLMAERAGEPEASPQGKPLSRSELREGLSEMGLDDPGRLDAILAEMGRKGYVELDAQDRLVPDKPTLSMARLLDHAFPGMPGINLVAYFVQTLDEVESGRKPPKSALLQLDQMLRHHGAAPFGRVKKEREARPAAPRRPRLQRPARLRAPNLRDIPVPSAEERAHTEPVPNPESVPEAEGAVEAPLPPEPAEAEEEGAGVLEAVEEPWDGQGEVETPDREPLPEQEPVLDQEQETKAPPASMETASGEPDLAPPPDPDEAAAPGKPDRDGPPPEAIEASQPSLPGEQGSASDPEARVEDRVSAFEEELAMQCPVCRKASVEVRKTAKGRVYYKCSDEACMFISWGRPHHIPCPLCGNPFLVEMDAGEDPKPLKCPRATCRYREPAPGEGSGDGAVNAAEARAPAKGRTPRKRVVRRKVRRRKR